MKFQEQKLEVSYASVVVLRIMLSDIFIVASINQLVKTEHAVQRIANAKMGFIWAY